MEKPTVGDPAAQLQNSHFGKQNSKKIFMQKTVTLNVGVGTKRRSFFVKKKTDLTRRKCSPVELHK